MLDSATKVSPTTTALKGPKAHPREWFWRCICGILLNFATSSLLSLLTACGFLPAFSVQMRHGKYI